LEGLEISEILCQEVMAGTATARFDPEYFNRAALDTLALLAGGLTLGELVKDGYRVVYETTEAIDRQDGEPDGLPYFLQAADISTPFIKAESMVCVAQSDWERYPKGRVQPGELLIEVKGKAEKIALVPDDFPRKTLVSGTCFKLTTNDPVDQYFLAAYLTCRHGQILKDRLKSNLLVSYLAKDDLYRLPVPNVSATLKSQIRAVFGACFAQHRDAESLMRAAESTLMHALDLDNWQAPAPLSYVRNSREAFAVGRLDAEHFKPKYGELITRLVKTGNAVRLGDLLTVNDRGNQPDYADEGLPVINSKHVIGNEVRLDSDNRKAIASTAKILIEPGDLLMNGTGVGTIGRSAPYLHAGKAIPDNHVTVLRPKPNTVDPIFLAVFINSLAGQMQVEQRLHGSSGQIELYPSDIADFTVWIAPDTTQREIRLAVESGFASKRRATQLLDSAKRAVEIAIENSEAAALAYLAAVAGAAGSCDDNGHDGQATQTNRPTLAAMARPASGRGQPAGRLSGQGAGFHAEFDGTGKRAGGSGAGADAADSTRPLDATRELASAAGLLPYSEVAERLAAKVADCIDTLLDADPATIALSPEWLRDIHRRIASDLFPDWAGRFRTTDVQVGSHFPPPAHEVPVRVRDFCLDLEERLRHLGDAASQAELLAWADWRFQWTHPFKDFNGRVGRIMLIALAFRLGLPPIDPAGDVGNKDAYFSALRAADTGDLRPLTEIWLNRL
jgi:type I restriction enzyme, S subunit